MFILLTTIYCSVAAVRSGPVSPVVPRGNGQDENLNGSFKYCCCVDGNYKELNTPTNDVYHDYLQTIGNGIKLDYDSSGAPFVSYSVFISSSLQPAVLSSPFTSFFPFSIPLIFFRC